MASSDQGSYAKPLLCKHYPFTRGCSRRKSLFLNFAENAKVAATGFERETRGNLLSLSNSLSFWKINLEKLDFWSNLNLIFTAYVVCKIQVQSRPKTKFIQLKFLNSIFQKSNANQ